jgi:hypothetical protein
MMTLRHLLLVGTVWLTAAMLVVAGTLHFQCGCPDPQAPPSALEQRAGCGCCCDAHHAPGSGDQTSCCAPPQEDRSDPCPTGRPGCTLALVPSEPLTAGQAKTTVDKDLTSAVHVFAYLGCSPVPVPYAAGGSLGQQLHSLAPPTDLVTALLHLLI